jgi:hypothetical protein
MNGDQLMDLIVNLVETMFGNLFKFTQIVFL